MGRCAHFSCSGWRFTMPVCLFLMFRMALCHAGVLIFYVPDGALPSRYAHFLCSGWRFAMPVCSFFMFRMALCHAGVLIFYVPDGTLPCLCAHLYVPDSILASRYAHFLCSG